MMKEIAGKPLVYILVAAVLCSTALCSAAENVQTGDAETVDRAGLAGCYDVTGLDTEEIAYTGNLCIEVVGDLLYELKWTQMEDDEGRVLYNGRGVSMGEDLFAVWSEGGSGYECYLHLFDIDLGDGSLSGLRVSADGAASPQTGTRKGDGARLDWSKPGRLAGSYSLESPEELPGKTLTVTQLQIDDDDAYSFRWSGGAELEGIGVREDDAIIVVAKPADQMSGTCGLISYRQNKDDRTLVGTFYTPDSLRGTTPRRRGEETATPKK